MIFSRKLDCISFGSATIDIFMLSKGFEVIPHNEQNILCASHGEKIDIQTRVITSGGGGTNVASGMAKLGLKTAVCSRIGQDFLGKHLLKLLKKEKVNTSRIQTRKTDETDQSVILVDPDGGRTILVYRGKTSLKHTDINWKNLSAKWFYICSLEGNFDLTEKLFTYASKKNIKVAWNPGKRELKNSNKVLELLKLTSFLLLNEEEAKFLFKKDQLPEQELLHTHVPVIAITQGRDGAMVLSENKKIHKNIVKVKTVEETGAGDAFGSAFVAGLIKNRPIEECLDWGLTNSASVVSKIGAKEGQLSLMKIKR